MSEPQLAIEPLGDAKRDGDNWRTTWRVANLRAEPVRVLGAIAPHSRFRGEVAVDREVRGKSTTQLSLVVRVDGGAGAEIENAFVILLVQQGEERWRVLARLRVPLDGEARPRPRIEAVTVQRVGFSGEL
ncbi:MAG TPA: hypothetical protein VGK07_11280 [Candidatus Limnocylindria bacterium]